MNAHDRFEVLREVAELLIERQEWAASRIVLGLLDATLRDIIGATAPVVST